MQAEKAEEMLESEGYTITKFNTTGGSNEVPSPWLSVLDQAVKTVDKFGSKFGFTPLDVQKIPAIVKEKESVSLLK
jgi:phage terminase small subunit